MCKTFTFSLDIIFIHRFKLEVECANGHPGTLFSWGPCCSLLACPAARRGLELRCWRFWRLPDYSRVSSRTREAHAPFGPCAPPHHLYQIVPKELETPTDCFPDREKRLSNLSISEETHRFLLYGAFKHCLSLPIAVVHELSCHGFLQDVARWLLASN